MAIPRNSKMPNVPVKKNIVENSGPRAKEVSENSDSNNVVEEGFVVDKRTGKRHKEINKIKARDLNSISSLMEYMEEHPEEMKDFDGFGNMRASADLFMSHLRVPPNKEEQKRLLEEKAEQIRKQNKKWKKEQEEIDSKSKKN